MVPILGVKRALQDIDLSILTTSPQKNSSREGEKRVTGGKENKHNV